MGRGAPSTGFITATRILPYKLKETEGLTLHTAVSGEPQLGPSFVLRLQNPHSLASAYCIEPCWYGK